MEREAIEGPRKRMKLSIDEAERELREGGGKEDLEAVEKEGGETEIVGSDEMELNIAQVYEKIERYTQMVSEVLESWKAMFKELSNEFEDRLITLHREQMEKWQEEIKELRLLDATNEEANVVLTNAKYLLQNPDTDS